MAQIVVIDSSMYNMENDERYVTVHGKTYLNAYPLNAL